MDDVVITEINLKEIINIKSLLEVSTFKPYRFISKGVESELNAFWLEQIENAIVDNQRKVFAYMLHKKPAGFMVFGDLPWDSKVFGIRMASISDFAIDHSISNRKSIAEELVNYVLDFAGKKGYKFILCKTYTDDMLMIHCLENAGFQLMGTILDYCVDYRSTPFSSITEPKKIEDIIIRFAKPEDEKELEDLAKAAFKNHFGRYHADPHFTIDQATEVYVEWVRSSLRGYADYFVLAEIEGRIAGLSVWKKTSQAEEKLPIKISHCSIAAVHPDFFGRGLFTKLTYEGMKLFSGKTDIIEAPTHINNYAAQRGCTRLNLQICDARHSFHKWLDQDELRKILIR